MRAGVPPLVLLGSILTLAATVRTQPASHIVYRGWSTELDAGRVSVPAQERADDSAAARTQQRGTPVRPSDPAAAARAQPAAGVLKLTRLSVRDPGINNIEAISFLIPSGWKAEGGIQWFRDFRILACLLMRITDPQTGAAVEFLPLQYFTWMAQMVVPMQPGTNYLGNVLWPPITDIPQFIQSFYFSSTLRHLQNARQVANEDLPRLAALAAQTSGAPNARSGRVRYEYEAGGQSWEEDVYVTLLYTPLPGMTIWSVGSARSFRAPKGRLDGYTPVMTTIVSTSRLSLDWFAGYSYTQKLFDERMRQGIRNAGIISQTIARNSEEIRQMFADSYRERNAAQDRMSQSFSEYIRGVETYRNPYEGSPIQLPSGYSSVWVNRSGEYVLSDQAGFNPNVGSNVEWRRVEKAP
jgi:hypothetical protein